MLDIFQFDKDYEENEKKWNMIKAEILGEKSNPNNPEEEEEQDEELNAELEKQEENKNVNLNNKIINYIASMLLSKIYKIKHIKIL